MGRLFKIVLLVLPDAVLINISFILALLVKTELSTVAGNFSGSFEIFIKFWFPVTVVKLLIFYASGLYKNMWDFAEGRAFLKAVGAVVASNILCGIFLMIISDGYQKSLVIITIAFDILLVGGARTYYRFRNSNIKGHKWLKGNPKSAMIVGAGFLGAEIIKELQLNHGSSNIIPVVAVDENKELWGNYISGVKIEGGKKDISRLVRKYKIDYIYITVTDAKPGERERLALECEKTDCRVKVIPEMHEIIRGKVGINKSGDIDLEEILGSKKAEVNDAEILTCVQGKSIMITGGSSVLGSELCKKLGKYDPKKIVVLDTDEQGIFNICREMNMLYPDIEMSPIMCPVTETNMIREVFYVEKPDVVIHTALYKNPELMEYNPRETIRNNIFGTLTLVNECENSGTEKFVVISSNKVMYPEGIVGAVYKIIEMLIRLRGKRSGTKNIAIRIGNIIEDKDSEINRLLNQAKHGEPLTISHTEAVKSFVRVNEISQMVLQTMAIAKGQEVFAINLGWSVRVRDLAEYIIKHSGMKLNGNSNIQVKGLSAGESIFENLLPDEDELTATSHKEIYIVKPKDINVNTLEKGLGNLWKSVRSYDNTQIRIELSKIISEYLAGNQE